MHWSSTLERRFIPPDARIVADLHCPGCAYSLRGLEALGRCPECGRRVLDSIRPIPEPARLTKTLGEGGWAFLLLLPVILVSVNFAPVTAGVGILLMLTLAGFRAFAAVGLRKALATTPAHGCDSASSRLLMAVAIEFVPLTALLILVITQAAGSTAAWLPTAIGYTPLAIVLVALLQIGAVADLARRIARWLELQRMQREANLSLTLLLVGIPTLMLGALTSVGGMRVSGPIGLLGAALIVFATILATRALWRAAATIPRLDRSPATLIDRPLMSPAEMQRTGLLPSATGDQAAS